MKAFAIIAFSALQSLAAAPEVSPPGVPASPIEESSGSASKPDNRSHGYRRSRLPRPPRAWLGVDLTKPDAGITAQIPALPPGVGFVIRSVEKDGPGQTAGLAEFDVIWKFNDQLLINESQLAALLRLSKPGEEINLSGFRAGKSIELKLTLGETPLNLRPFPSDLVEDSVFPGTLCGGPMREVIIGKKTATYTIDEGRVEVSKPGETYLVKITKPEGEILFEGELKSDEDYEKIPHDWRRRVHALRRGLDLALAGSTMAARQPRPRVVPPGKK